MEGVDVRVGLCRICGLDDCETDIGSLLIDGTALATEIDCMADSSGLFDADVVDVSDADIVIAWVDVVKIGSALDTIDAVVDGNDAIVPVNSFVTVTGSLELTVKIDTVTAVEFAVVAWLTVAVVGAVWHAGAVPVICVTDTECCLPAIVWR